MLGFAIMNVLHASVWYNYNGQVMELQNSDSKGVLL